MLEILCKFLFFLSMLVAYAYVTSTSKVIVIVLSYTVCVFSYYYFNVIQSAIDELFKYFNFKEKFNGSINSAQVPMPYVNPVESASYHNIKYPTLRQMSNYRFDKSTLRHLSKMPRVSSTPAIRIAPPEPISVNLVNDKYITNNDRYSEDTKNDNYLQVLRDISRKRNYQEEIDRIDSTPKKSRKNDIRNFMTSHYKRSHDDSSNDNLDDTSRKKRCSDSDRSVAKMMSYTSSMSVIAPNFTWNNHSKKRKSSRIEKSKNESPEKVEKVRKIDPEEANEDISNYQDEQMPENHTYVVKQHVITAQVHENCESPVTNGEVTDGPVYEPPIPDDDGEYVKVASGKILNRTNCMYRRKLNSNRIDPQSVISIEPELANGTSNEDDEDMKKNLLRNLIDDIERKGEKDDSVIFYQNSIVEEIAKNQQKIESVKPEVALTNATLSYNPLLSQTINDSVIKPTFNSAVMSTPSVQSQPSPKQLDLSKNITFGNTSIDTQPKGDSNSTPMFNASAANNSTFNANPIQSSTFNLSQTSNSLTFGNTRGVDTVDSSPKLNTSKVEDKKEVSTVVANNSNTAITFTSAIGSINSTSSAPVGGNINSTSSAPVAGNINSTSSAPVAGNINSSSSAPVAGNISSNTNTFTSAVATTDTTTVQENSPKSGFSFPGVVSTAPSNTPTSITTPVNSSSFNIAVSSPQQNISSNAISTTRSKAPVMTFGAASSPFSFGSANQTKDNSSLPQFGNTFASATVKPAEDTQKSSLSQITMFGNTAMSAPSSTTSNSAFTPSSSTFSSATPSSGFQFGQSAVPSTNTGFSFGSGASNSNGFGVASATSTPTLFSNSTPAFGTASTTSFNSTSGISFTSSTPTAFGTDLKFEAKPTQPTPSFAPSSFNATTSSSSFAAPSVPAFGNTSNATFGTPSGGFGTTNNTPQNTTFGTSNTQVFGAVSNQPPAFGNTTSQPVNSTFGNTAQPNSTFGVSQPPAFGSTHNTMFGSGDTSAFSQPAAPAFGANSSQFGNSTGFSFGSTSNTQPPPAFGSTPSGGAGAAQQSNFNSSSTFNFSAGGSSFGNNVFGAAPAKPAENTFTFGGNPANAQAPPNPVFQFGSGPSAPAPAPQSQPFQFAAGSGSTGGFSIGAGGSTRNRANNRNKRK